MEINMDKGNEIRMNLVKNLYNIINMIEEKTNENLKIVQDLADRIGVLSMNVFVESAKAGERGKGFRVISNEIRKMSEDIRKIVKNIVAVNDETKDMAQNLLHKCGQSPKNIVHMIYIDNHGFDVFYKTLNHYYADLKNIFNKLTVLVQEIMSLVYRFYPIFHVHDISVQAMGDNTDTGTRFIKGNKENVNEIHQRSNKTGKKETI